MKKFILVAFLMLRASSAYCEVYFYSDSNCLGTAMKVTKPAIEELKDYTFRFECEVPEYPRVVDSYAGPGARSFENRFEKGKWEMVKWKDDWCEASFNDHVRSVFISNAERIYLYQHPGFRGHVEFVGNASGCFNVHELRNKASSVEIEGLED